MPLPDAKPGDRQAGTPLKKLAAAIKARWLCEQAHQQLKEELGLVHFEGRSWTGLHRHCLMAMIPFAFPSISPPQSSGTKKESERRRHNRPCQPAGKPSSTSSHGRDPAYVLIVINSLPNPSRKICQSSARSEPYARRPPRHAYPDAALNKPSTHQSSNSIGPDPISFQKHAMNRAA